MKLLFRALCIVNTDAFLCIKSSSDSGWSPMLKRLMIKWTSSTARGAWPSLVVTRSPAWFLDAKFNWVNVMGMTLAACATHDTTRMVALICYFYTIVCGERRDLMMVHAFYIVVRRR